MKHILVIGATGTVGGEVLHQLAPDTVKIRAVSRNPDPVNFPPHVEVLHGDLTLPDTFDHCLDSIDTVFLVWVAPASTVSAIIERIAKHARRIVFLPPRSKLRIRCSTAQPCSCAQRRNRAPNRILRTPVDIPAPGMFAANALDWWAPQIRAGDVVRWPSTRSSHCPDSRARHRRGRRSRALRRWTCRCRIRSDRSAIAHPRRTNKHYRSRSRPHHTRRRAFAGRSAPRAAPHHACPRREHAPRRLGSRCRPARLRQLDCR